MLHLIEIFTKKLHLERKTIFCKLLWLKMVTFTFFRSFLSYNICRLHNRLSIIVGFCNQKNKDMLYKLANVLDNFVV